MFTLFAGNQQLSSDDYDDDFIDNEAGEIRYVECCDDIPHDRSPAPSQDVDKPKKKSFLKRFKWPGNKKTPRETQYWDYHENVPYDPNDKESDDEHLEIAGGADGYDKCCDNYPRGKPFDEKNLEKPKKKTKSFFKRIGWPSASRSSISVTSKPSKLHPFSRFKRSSKFTHEEVEPAEERPPKTPLLTRMKRCFTKA